MGNINCTKSLNDDYNQTNLSKILSIPSDLFKSTNFLFSENVCAIYDYNAVRSDELSFHKGDEINAFIDSNKEWWFARKRGTSESGYIPSNFVVIVDSVRGKKCLDGWWPIDKDEATHKLLNEATEIGNYILRPCSDRNNLAISVFCYEYGSKTVKHYKINLENCHYYINELKTFKTLSDLFKYYTDRGDGLCCRLANPLINQSGVSSYLSYNSTEIDRENLKIIKQIGKGHYGEVFQATLRRKLEVAVKQLHNHECNRIKFLKEAESLQRLNHQRIVKLIGVCTLPAAENVLIVTELLSNGSLSDFFKNQNSMRQQNELITNGKLNIKFIIRILSEITEGMKYLESKSFLHRDLRTANILVADDWSVKVADFGLAKVLEEVYLPTEADYDFPVRWMALEVITESKFCIRSDVWSFGILMYEVITLGGTPYPGLSSTNVIEYVKKGKLMSKPPNCSSKYYLVMKQCWKKHRKRPSFSYLYTLFSQWLNTL